MTKLPGIVFFGVLAFFFGSMILLWVAGRNEPCKCNTCDDKVCRVCHCKEKGACGDRRCK